MKLFTWIAVLVIAFGARVMAAPFALVNNGPASNRINLFFLGDGYTQAEVSLGVYDRDIEGYLDHLFNESGYLSDPFKRYQKFFNVYKANVVSTQSGADIPHASPPVFVNTALDASYEYAIDGLDDRALEVNDTKADNARNNSLAGSGISADMQFVTVNSSKYGGTGGPWAVFAGGNDEAHEIALHESGHSFAGLADEYGGFTTTYTGAEPTEPDVTKDPTGAKWSRWLGFHDPRGSNLNIGVFEGARYYDKGLYRPSLDSKMRELDQGFDAVSREQFILDFYEKVDPLDSWLGNKTTVTSGDLWVKSIDPNVIATKWYVNNTLVPGATGESFNPADFGFGNGTYQVRAHSYDTVLDHSYDGGLLDLVRTDYDLLQEDISWTYTEQIVKLPGDFNLNGVVDVADYIKWRNGLGTTYTAADYNTWRTHFGQEAGAGASAGFASVPEPTGIALFVVGISALSLGRRRAGSAS